MIRKSLTLIVIFFLFPSLILAQGDVQTPTETTAQTANRLFNQGADLSDAGNFEDALPLLQDALKLAQAIKDQNLESQILNSIGFAYSGLGKNEPSLEYYYLALAIERKTKDRKAEAFTLLNIGVAYFDLDDYSNTAKTFKEALVVQREVGNTQLQGISLSYLAAIYTKYKMYPEAKAARLEMLEVQKVRNDQKGMLFNLFSLGQLLETQQQYDDAIVYYTQSLKLAQKLQLPTETGITLDRIGNLYYTVGRYKEAADYLSQGLKIWRSLGNQVNQTEDLLDLGRIARFQSKNGIALTYYEEALAIAKDIKDDNRVLTALIGAANVYSDQGKTSLALETYQQALSIATTNNDLIGQNVILSNMSSIQIDQGHYADAISALNKALSVARGTNNVRFIVPTLSHLCDAYYAIGNTSRALEYCQEALDLVDNTNESILLASMLNKLGMLYANSGQYDIANSYLLRGLDISRQSGDRRAEVSITNNIGANYVRLGKYDDAKTLFEEALQQFRSEGEEDGEQRMLYQIGGVYGALGDFDNAIEKYNQALVIAQKIGVKNEEADILFALGQTYRAKSDSYAAPDQGMTLDDIQAYNHFTQALEIYKANGKLVEMARAYTERGRVSEDPFGDNKELTVSNYQSAINVIEEIMRSAVLDTAITQLKNEDWITEPYIRLGLSQIRGDVGRLHIDLANALNYLERGRAILTRVEIAAEKIDFRSNSENTLLVEEENLRLQVSQAQNQLNVLLSSDEATTTAIQDAQHNLDEISAKYQQHIDMMQLQGGLLSNTITFSAAKLQDIQAALPADTTLIVYTLPSSFNMVYIITHDEITFGRLRDLERNPQGLQQLIIQLRESGYLDTQILEQLYKFLIAPIEGQVKTSRMIISPEGLLNYVPFAALRAADGSYLIEKYAISTIPSGTILSLLHNRNQSSPYNPPLVLAQPDAPGLSSLGFAPNEALAVAHILDTTANINATETELRTGVKGSPVLVISAHASVKPSIIYLGNTSNNGDNDADGYLEAREIYSLDLTSTRLVVLSGCDTATGGDGEDFGMLTRAFMAAGAQQVVASLWKVDDKATAELMTAFIKEWKSSDNAADALRKAMIATKAKYPEPYKWASFVLVGQPDQIPFSSIN